jgi:hypothetical protein
LALRRLFILILVSVILSPMIAHSQTRRRSAPKRSATASKAAEKSSAEIKAGRERIATQIKTLTQFLYLLGPIVKGIDSADQATRTGETSSIANEQNQRNKAKVRDSIRNVREGLDRLETDFRSNPTLKTYYPYISGVAITGEAAENQASAGRFDEAGRSLLKAVGQLADALAAMR